MTFTGSSGTITVIPEPSVMVSLLDGALPLLEGVFDAKPFLTRWWLTAGYHLLTVLFLLFTVFYGWLAFR